MLLYTLEVHAESATLHLRDLPRETDLAAARLICRRLPASVCVLRVNFRSLNGLEAAVREGIMALVHDWHRERFDVVSLAGTGGNGLPSAAEHTLARPPAPVPGEAALMATFL